MAVCAQAGLISPLAYSAYSYAPLPVVARPIDGTYTERQFIAPRLIAPYSYAAPLAYAAAPYPAAHYYSAPAPLAYAAPAAVVATPLEATYTAANRGAVHVAPLPGHTESTSSVNLEAAPGTL